jgi:hypothetical protein
MSDTDALVRQKLLKEIGTKPPSKWDKSLDITTPKYVVPRSVDIQQKIKGCKCYN